ncbi:molybdopterin-dependent oxidoreductase, partial [Kitasatospora cineracea]|uniref:molybdopterin-dependent oxidoreductase n=1 Tax=Kitasatospora cineracea TaxID=88074 RepID=UPI0037982DF7
MSLSPGFSGRRGFDTSRLPPGQFLTEDFPVLSAGPTPEVPLDRWEFTLTTESGEQRRWNWQQFLALPQQDVTTDLHCVTRWSKFDT